MGNINPTFFNRVKYVLSCPLMQSDLEPVDPIGWKSDEKEFSRNEEYHGIFTKFSNSLKFIEDARDYINYVRELYGINAEIKLSRYEKHPHTDKWTRGYWGYLDLSTWADQNNEVSIKFNSGGLEQTIKARENELVEIDRIVTMDGKPIPELVPKEVALEGRRIFLKSKWEVQDNDNSVFLSVFSDDGNIRSKATGYPFKLIVNSHEQAQSVITGSGGNDSEGTTGLIILANFDRTRTMTIKGRDLKLTPVIEESDWSWAYFQVNLTTYKDGLSYNIKERRILLHYGHGVLADLGNPVANVVYNPGIWYINNQLLTIPDFNEEITVEAGDSIGIEIIIKSDLRNFATSRARYHVRVNEIKGIAFCEEDSFFEPSKANFILTHDLIDRLATICGNDEKLFYSEYFGRTELGYAVDGPGAYFGNTHGFWIRGFDKLPLSTVNDPNLFKPLTTSLKESVDSAIAVFNVGLGMEEINNKERIRIEPKSHFYDNNITIRLPNQVKNVKRSEAVNYYASSIEVGFDKGGSYQEAQGLDEPNGKSNFTTVITRIKETFSQISSYRADSYGKEFARRKPFSQYDSEDTQYDEDVFWLDLKRSLNDMFLERKWQDDFEQAPTGIFSPETANGLRFSPFNMMLRHGWVIAAGLTKYPLDYIRYGSSTANSQLKTKLVGGIEYAENGNIINSELQTARFTPEWIEFEHECTFEIMEIVQGSTVILGKTIPNFYGTVEFINEKNIKEKGFLFNLKPNGKGTWKILKSNRK